MEFLQKNVTNLMLLIITLLSTEVDLKTEFLPEFENNVSTNNTVQVKNFLKISQKLLVTSFSICNSWSISFHNGWWKLFFIVMAINGWIIELHSNKIWSHKFSFSSLFCKVKCSIIYQTILIFSGGRYRGYRVQNKERIQQIRLNEWQKKNSVHFLPLLRISLLIDSLN